MTNKLTEARLHWARNDWEALDCIDLDEVQSSKEKTEILLYKATACCQLGQVDLAKKYFHLVSSSEINSALLERVLISGAFNSLGRAFREKDEGDVQTSDLYFRKAAKVALGRDFDLTRDGSSRQSQLSRIDNIAEVMREGGVASKLSEGHGGRFCRICWHVNHRAKEIFMLRTAVERYGTDQ